MNSSTEIVLTLKEITAMIVSGITFILLVIGFSKWLLNKFNSINIRLELYEEEKNNDKNTAFKEFERVNKSLESIANDQKQLKYEIIKLIESNNQSNSNEHKALGNIIDKVSETLSKVNIELVKHVSKHEGLDKIK